MKYRYQIPLFAFYDHTGMSCHLEKMARRGWMVDKLGNFLWRYRAIEPQRLRFSIVYFPEVTGFEPGTPEGHQKMEELCDGTGWQLAATAGKFQAYFNEEPDPVELETDPVVQVAVIHRTMKKSLIPAYLLLIVAALFNLYTQFEMLKSSGSAHYSGLVYYFSSVSWMMLPCWFLLMGIYLLELSRYFLWYRRAKRRAEDGLHTPSVNSLGTQLSVYALLLLLIASWFTTSQMGNIVLPVLGILTAATAAAVLTSRLLRKKGVSAGVNRAVTMAVAMLLSLGLVHGTTFALLKRNRELEQQNEHAPLRAEDLGWAADDSGFNLETQSSPLITRLYCTERIGGYTADRKYLEYIVADIRFKPLLQPCLENFLGEAAVEQDAALWQADQAWEVKAKYFTERSYVLRWENRLVWIYLDGAPTPEQMQTITQALRP